MQSELQLKTQEVEELSTRQVITYENDILSLLIQTFLQLTGMYIFINQNVIFLKIEPLEVKGPLRWGDVKFYDEWSEAFKPETDDN